MNREMKDKLDKHITGNFGEDQFEHEFFDEPKSWCYCGHLGDGLNSQHGGLNGHGACQAESWRKDPTEDNPDNHIVIPCDCKQFTWKRFTNRFNEWYAKKEG